MATSPLSFLVLLFISFSSSLHVYSERCNPNDKKALLQIKNDLNNPYDLTSWKPELDCCDWYVVKCDKETNRITNFDLAKSDLKLPIPSSIGDLPFLQSLTFHHTNVTGEIPQAITKLSHLNFLDLSNNFLTGPVPSFLGQLKKLTYIGLSFNSLTGSIPASLSELPELGGLRLDRNKLTGSIPESFADFKQKDFYLYLSNNNLSGQIPRKLGYTNFSWIDVSRNRLEGDISFLFGKNKSLDGGHFSRNLFEFDFSQVEISEKLRNLDLNHNKIYGSLPKGLVNVDTYLNVSYNRLCGQIPTGGTAMLQKLDYTVFFHNKCLCGAPLPPCK